MTVEDRMDGWWEMPPLDIWMCPECKVETSSAEWAEMRPWCEDCGDHDGRECPNCNAVFDHVWGITRLTEANLAG